MLLALRKVVELDKIYTIYVVCLTEDGTDYKYGTSIKGNKYKLGDHICGWYKNFEDAENIVLNNLTDIFECMYNFACVEEIPEGVNSYSVVKQWYKATFNEDKIDTGHYPEVSKCDTPEVFKQIINFSMG